LEGRAGEGYCRRKQHVMTKTTPAGVSDEKLNQILQGAQKRFGTYGYEKTTMQEIADDLCISKALLYYYFPDKTELFKAVVWKEQKEFFGLVDDRLKKLKEPESMLREYITLRTDYFRAYLNLSKIRYESMKSFKPLLQELFDELHQKDVEVIRTIIDKGINEKHFHVEDAEETVSLFLHTIRSLRWSLLHHKDLMTMSQDDFYTTQKVILQFVDVFIRGISCQPKKK
jgi:AcrR family transcriptional regulator